MDMFTILIGIGAIALVWHVSATMIICGRLSDRGVTVIWPLIKMLYPKYVHQYRDMVKAETGHEAPVYYHWLLSISLVALVAIVMIVTKL